MPVGKSWKKSCWIPILRSFTLFYFAEYLFLCSKSIFRSRMFICLLLEPILGAEYPHLTLNSQKHLPKPVFGPNQCITSAEYRYPSLKVDFAETTPLLNTASWISKLLVFRLSLKFKVAEYVSQSPIIKNWCPKPFES